MSYDEQYARVDALFGTEPEAVLRAFADRLKRGSVVLDVGAGQGRNALFMAESGFTVHALEPSTVAAAALGDLAEKKRLAIEVFSSTFEEFDPPVGGYAGIMAFGLIPDLDWTGIRKLVARIDRWGGSGPGTVIWITGFTTRDPAYDQYRSSCTFVDHNSFRTSEGRVRTYLEPGQIVELFEGYSVLHHREGLGEEHRHGDGPVERHGVFEAVLVR